MTRTSVPPVILLIVLLAACGATPEAPPSATVSVTTTPAATHPSPARRRRVPRRGRHQPPNRLMPWHRRISRRGTKSRRRCSLGSARTYAPRGVTRCAKAYPRERWEESSQIGSELADGVGFYRFPDLPSLMTVYQGRMSQYGIPLATDVPMPHEEPRDCWRGHESESFFWPNGEGPQVNRAGCFINEFGYANLRFVWGGPLVYIGVLGNGSDIAELFAWAMRGPAEFTNEPDAGAPGIWQPPPSS